MSSIVVFEARRIEDSSYCKVMGPYEKQLKSGERAPHFLIADTGGSMTEMPSWIFIDNTSF